MSRLHLFEFEDQQWCPKILRQLITNLLHVQLTTSKTYAPIIPKLKDTLQQLDCHHVIDLCSGSSGALVQSQETLNQEYGYPIRITLTDFFPNTEYFEILAQSKPDLIQFESESIDAANVPHNLVGFRSIFTAFHHFRVPVARAILKDAYAKRVPIGIFEFTSRTMINILKVLAFAPWVTLLQVPRIRPMKWQYLFWTYIIPISPFIYTWDALVSHLRTYSPQELKALIFDLNDRDYQWEIGEIKHNVIGFSITYLIGRPNG
jgi:hypothetical protein